MATTEELKTAVDTLRNYCNSGLDCTKDCEFSEHGECSFFGRIPSEWEYPVPKFNKLKLSNTEIQLLKICKQLGYDRIKKREHLGNIFTIAFGSEKYRTWRLPEEWGNDDALFKDMEMNQPAKIDDLLAEAEQ